VVFAAGVSCVSRHTACAARVYRCCTPNHCVCTRKCQPHDSGYGIKITAYNLDCFGIGGGRIPIVLGQPDQPDAPAGNQDGKESKVAKNLTQTKKI